MQFIALTSIGIENLLADELKQLGVQIGKQSVGSVVFEADLPLAQKVCLSTRFATRILMKIAEKENVKNKTDLYNLARYQAWGEWLTPTTTFAIDFSGTNTELKNTQFSSLVIKDAIVDYFQDLYESRPDVDKQNAQVRIAARYHQNKLDLYIDYSGTGLSQRGYRQGQGRAPIKEHLAAALIQRSGWLKDVSQPLFDPCCGSGTLLIEAAGMANNEAPGLKKEQFAFERLPNFNESQYQEVREELIAKESPKKLYLIGQDIDGYVLSKAQNNARAAGVEHLIKFSKGDAANLKPVSKRAGVVLSNLPYGERMGGTAELINLYRNMGIAFKKYYADWYLALLSSDEALSKLLKIVRHKRYKFKNGPIDCVLNTYILDEKQVIESTHSTELNYEDSTAFANRLKKNKQGLKSWLKQHGITTYRLYDADIPQYNVAVDIYNDHAVIYEYAAPKDVNEEVSNKRLQDIIYLTGKQLDIPAEKIVVKVRKKQKGDSQYRTISQQDQSMVVTEYGAKFKVNLFDYLDTGLFLDHRLARQYIQQNAQDKRFLNLFAYTGTASVQAAIGGAKSITTVDMSKTYINWGKENFELNNIQNPRYRFFQADCLSWLEQAQGEYDLIFLDPPTFSNSKRMTDAFDVQRDHIKLFETTKNILSEEGVLFFSNNKRGFKMDEEALTALGLKAKNISDKTLSPDFKRNKNIHNSWLITRV